MAVERLLGKIVSVHSKSCGLRATSPWARSWLSSLQISVLLAFEKLYIPYIELINYFLPLR